MLRNNKYVPMVTYGREFARTIGDLYSAHLGELRHRPGFAECGYLMTCSQISDKIWEHTYIYPMENDNGYIFIQH